MPDGWEEHPNARYPLIVEQDHFHRGLPGIMAFRTQPPSDTLKGGELRAAKNGYKLYQDWTAGRLPRVIVLSIQHATPYFDDSYAVNSENVGPYGDAITQELIPYVEKQFRGHRTGMGPRRLRRIHRRMGKPCLASLLPRFLQRSMGLLP